MNPRSTGSPTRRRVVQAGALATGSPLLAACGGSGGLESGPATSKPARSVPINIWARNASDKLVFDQIVGVAEARAPHLAITSEAVTGIYDKLIVTLAGGGAPDLIVVNVPSGVPLLGQGAFVKLQPFLAKDKATEQELKNFAEPAL